MTTTLRSPRGVAFATSMVALTLSMGVVADDVVSFSTGGYAAGVRTKEIRSH
jgi:hypothetical protein